MLQMRYGRCDTDNTVASSRRYIYHPITSPRRDTGF